MTSPNAPTRRVELDWIRIVAFGLLILYHIGMCYATWDWHDAVKSRHASHAVEPLLMLTVPWRMSLLFAISGAATSFMTARMTPTELAWNRSRRLLPPLVFGVLVIVPPQVYCQVVENMGYTDSYLAFWLRYLSADQGFCRDGRCLVLPTYNHLWFVAYLWVYTLLLAAALAIPRPARATAGARLARVLLSGSGAGVVLWPWLLLALTRIALIDRFPPTYALAGDWYDHANYLIVFLFGFGLLRREDVSSAIERYRWPALGLAVASYLFLIGDSSAHIDAPSAAGGARWLRHAVTALDQWCAIVAILGFGRRRIRHDGPARRYLTDAVFPYYIVHQTAIVVYVHLLRRFDLPAGWEAAILVGATAATCAATYELVRRVDWLRPLFGLRARKTRPAADIGRA